MAAVVIETETRAGGNRRPYFSAIRWTAILGGVIAGLGSYMLLALLGVAMGLTAIDPQAAEPVRGVPVGMGIWTGLITLVAAFIGGYIAARMSGLARTSDGMLHGFMNWAATTVLFAFLATTAVSAVLGGTFAMLGQSLQTAATAEGGQQQEVGGIGAQLQRIITGSEGGQISAEDLDVIQQYMQAGDRQAAIDHMVNNMGFTQQRANQMADMASPLFTGELGQQAQQAAGTAVDTMATASWWLFVGLALSLVVALIGGMLGVKAYANRAVGDHLNERRTARV